MESSNTKTWQSMQIRVENIQRRKALIPLINKLKKELLIIRMQVAKMEEKTLDNLYPGKKREEIRKTDELKVLSSQYLELADNEINILESNLQIIRKQRHDPTVYALDLKEYELSLEQAIGLLQQEKQGIESDTTQPAMARSSVVPTSIQYDENSEL